MTIINYIGLDNWQLRFSWIWKLLCDFRIWQLFTVQNNLNHIKIPVPAEIIVHQNAAPVLSARCQTTPVILTLYNSSDKQWRIGELYIKHLITISYVAGAEGR